MQMLCSQITIQLSLNQFISLNTETKNHYARGKCGFNLNSQFATIEFERNVWIANKHSWINELSR